MKKAVIVGLGQLKRIQLIKSILEDEYEVKILIHDYDHAKKQYKVNRDPQYIYLHMPRFKKNISPARAWAYYVWGNNIYSFIKQYEPDLVYVILPPNYISHKCFRYCKKHKEVKLIADVYNIWPEAMPVKKYEKYASILLKGWAGLRNKCLSFADQVFLECEYYLDFLKDVPFKKSPEILYLYKEQSPEERQHVEEVALKQVSKRNMEYSEKHIIEQVTIGYLGGINNIIDIEGICRICGYLIQNGVKVDVRIIGLGESKDSLVTKLEKIGAKAIYYGPIYDNIKKIDILGECDLCINMMKETVAVGLTTKSTDYFSIGLPLLNTIKGDTWRIIEEYKAGFNYTGMNGAELVSLIKNNELLKMKANALRVFDEKLSYNTIREKAIRVLKSIDIVST